MKHILLIAVMLAAASTVFAGEWSRENETTIAFKGEIQEDEYDRFARVFDAKVRVLKVDSQGGETSAGMQIGSILRQNNIAIEVNHWCLSSCANYFFTGATKRTIVKGIVGFHGNVKACFTGEKWTKLEEDLRKQGLSEDRIQAVKANIDRQVPIEASFLQSIGVSQEIFEVSCTLSKGMNDGKSYAFLLPTPDTFEKFGIKDVVGNQDPETIKAFPAPLAVW